MAVSMTPTCYMLSLRQAMASSITWITVTAFRRAFVTVWGDF